MSALPIRWEGMDGCNNNNKPTTHKNALIVGSMVFFIDVHVRLVNCFDVMVASVISRNSRIPCINITWVHVGSLSKNTIWKSWNGWKWKNNSENMDFQFESFVIRVLCWGARANAASAWARHPDITSMEWWNYGLVVLISSVFMQTFCSISNCCSPTWFFEILVDFNQKWSELYAFLSVTFKFTSRWNLLKRDYSPGKHRHNWLKMSSGSKQHDLLNLSTHYFCRCKLLGIWFCPQLYIQSLLLLFTLHLSRLTFLF